MGKSAGGSGLGRRAALGRRGLMAGVATVVAGALARFTAQPVEAGVDGDLVLNGSNTGTATTTLQSLAPAPGGSGYTVLQITNLRIADAIVANGGPGSLGNVGRRGVIATGGNNDDGTNALPSAGGDAILGTGGNTLSGVGDGGRGVRGTGGDAGTGTGGAGVLGEGGSGTTPGEGVVGQGGGSSGTQGNGVRGQTSSSTNAGVVGRNTGSGTGVRGQSTSGDAVLGESTSGVGVRGRSTGAGSSQPGVIGTSTGGSGVLGTSTANAGVFGTSTQSIGVFGLSPSVGVWGISTSPPNAPQAGVRGESTHGPGVFGQATNNAGIFGDSTGGNIGVFGRASFGTAILGQATDANGFAAQFFGRVNVVGDLILNGNALAGAAVQQADGSARRTYFVESAEATIDDVGQATLQSGRAMVPFDPEFAALILNDQYLVFLTPEGDCQGLYVAGKTASGFEVRELRGGASTLTFSYRVVARRRNGGGARLERVDLPRQVQAPRVPERGSRTAPTPPRLPDGAAVPSPASEDEDGPAEPRRHTAR